MKISFEVYLIIIGKDAKEPKRAMYKYALATGSQELPLYISPIATYAAFIEKLIRAPRTKRKIMFGSKRE
jgi:hypothetical protein